MDRRTALIAPLLAAGGLLMPMALRGARAQPGTISPLRMISVSDWKSTTLSYGTLAKETSQIAIQRSTNPSVRAFATGEILEQTAIAQSITAMADPPPAPLSPAQMADLLKVQNAPADQFDTTYLSVQISGHESLLMTQKSFLSPSPEYNKNLDHIALIAEAFIKNHLYILSQLNGSN